VSEIGSATFGLVVGLGRFRRELGQAEKEADKSGEEIGDELVDGATTKVEKGSGRLTSALTAIGVAGGAALGLAFAETLDIGAAEDKLAASLGLTGAAAERAGDTAGRLYADAYGESIEQVNSAVASVLSTLGDFAKTDADLERLSQHALNFAHVFDQDVAQAVGNAGVLINSGLARDADEAFDLLTASMQRVPVSVRDELMEATNEYSQFFAGLGLDGQQAMGILVEASKGGTYQLDKVGDALKELRIRATDMSAGTVAAYDTLGLNAEEMTAKLLTGGADAKSAFDQIVAGLSGIEDPATKANTAIALFGTPFEDISGDAAKTDELLRTLATGGMADVAGAATTMGETVNDNAATEVEEFRRGALLRLTNFIGNTAIPKMRGLVDWFGRNEDAALAAKVVLAGVAAAVATHYTVMATKAVYASAKTAASMGLMAAKWAWMGIQALAHAAKIALAWLISLGPIALVIAAVVGLVALIIIHFDTIKRWIGQAWEWVKEKTGQAWEWVKTKVGQAAQFITDLFLNWTLVGRIVKHWDTIKSAAGAAWDWITGKVQGVISWFTGVPGALASAASGMWDWITSSFKSALNSVIGVWNNFSIPSITIGGWNPPGPGPSFPSFSTPTINTPNIAYLEHGGSVLSQGAAWVGEAGPELLELPRGARVTPLDRVGSDADRGAGGHEIIKLYIDGRQVTEVVRDRMTDIRRRNGRPSLAGTF